MKVKVLLEASAGESSGLKQQTIVITITKNNLKFT